MFMPQPGPYQRLPSSRALPAELLTVGVSQLLGAVVYGLRGEPLGRVKDLVLDAQTGAVAYALLSVTSEHGHRRTFAIPWAMLRRDAGRNRWHAAIDRHTLEAASHAEHHEEPGDPAFDWQQARAERFGR